MNANQNAYYVLGDNEETGSSHSGLVAGDAKDAVQMKLSTNASKGSDAGEYPINGIFISSDKYEVKKVIPGKLTIAKGSSDEMGSIVASIKVLKDSVQDVEYDVQDFFGVYQVESIESNGEPTNDEGVIDGNISISGKNFKFRTKSVSTGTATIPLKAKFKNYEDKEFTVTVTVADKKTPYITGIEIASHKEYDGKPMTYTGTATVDGQVVQGATYEWYSGEYTKLTEAPVKPVNTAYSLTVTIPATENYERTVRKYRFTISPRQMEIIPNHASMTEGASLPTLTFAFGRLVENERIDLSGNTGGTYSPVFEILTQDGRVATTPLRAGEYKITLKNASALSTYLNKNAALANNGNYAYGRLILKEGTLTVNPDPSANQNQGNQNQGSQNGDNPSSSDDDSTESTVQDSSYAVEKSTVTTNSGMTTAAVKAEAKVSGKEVSAKLSDKGIENAVSLAENTAKKEKTAVSGVEIKLDTPKNAEAVKVEFSKKAVDTLAKSSIGSVSVDSELAAVSMDKKAIESVSKQSRSGIEVSVEKANTKLNEKQKAAVGEAPVYDITVKSGGKQITTFDGGLITVTLPYTLKKGELPNRVVIWYVDDMGNIKKVDSMYDAKTQRVMFTTDHLSKYVISYEAWKNGFLDVKEDAWYYGAVKYVAERALMSGTSEEMFSPGRRTTRAMLVTVLYRMEGMPKPSEGAGNPFADVAEDAYYAEAVKWAASVGIVKGIDSRTFAPNAPLSREQAAMMIFSYARHKGVSLQEEGDLSKFSDYASVSKWALPAVKWASGNGIINGRTGMLLDPKGRATRAEIAKILMELMERTK